MPARALLANLSTRGKIVLAGGALAIVVVLFFLFQIATAPSYTTLLTGMDPKDTGEVTAALDERGIAYELQNNGTALAVQKGQTAQARIALAGAGLPGNTNDGYKILDDQKMGTSNFQQNVNYQRALEGEIGTTIEEVDGVSSAQVQLVLPDREAQLFAENVNPATAAVLLSGASTLDEGQVRGIAQLVTNSVPGLKSEKVTITDSSGTMLWPTATSGSSSGLLAKQAAEARYNQQTATNITAMLARTVGPDKVQVQVKADLDANEATQDRLVYGRDGTPLSNRAERETLVSRGGRAGGPAGTAGNNPPVYAGQAGGDSDYRRESEDENLAVNKTVTRTRIAPGAVNRQQVAVLVDDSVPAAMLPQIRDAVMSAAGIDEDRGDVLTLGSIPFAELPRPAASSPVDDIWDYARYALLGMAALVFLALVARQLRKRENETLAGEPTWLREIESPRTLAELERFEEPVAPTQVLPLRSPENAARMQVEELVERDPERVAQHVRAWMQED
ncbi:flagellar basal-body MS-ring/collar protein FliF [Conexibacter woesei]|uniref:Flagellar M-ring protein n=1 Tax=Conexibacter woesei (strain DSM 14684 / CCUG 47730 / CIP 108061 / JCM 11494 / NBRC 100937 / ID131577) TaxID=469383 RepID=D3F3Z1_CONWI|nr:flagellar basal-body MS-ring/collar protein FliF [Conexibacter woesei]ADB48474.1 flagellar M-ring protein FliF [Conexibacter woesei DSM 14684]